MSRDSVHRCLATSFSVWAVFGSPCPGPAYGVAEVVVDPSRGFGQPIFARGGARVEDALALLRAGEPLDVVADEYGVPRAQLEDAVRIATRVAV